MSISGFEKQRVGYVYSQELIEAGNDLPRVRGRARLVAELIDGYGLHEDVMLIEPEALSIDEMSNFHSREYLEAFKTLCEEEDHEKWDKDLMDEYGLGYDCPVEEGLLDKCALISGGSVAAANALIDDQVDIAINWCGGWHHAKRFEAAGFCYINDIVLAAQKLREKYERILYVDLDLHHGDGVEEAFYATNKIYCLSLHKYSPGFYPGTGRLKDIGEGNGAYYTLNVPLKDGISTEQYTRIFKHIYEQVLDNFSPEAIICQCGADGLAMDEMDSFNLSSDAYINCLRLLLQSNKPTLLVGGGGYNFPNTARLWTLLTACCINKELSPDIPSDIESFMEFKPDFELSVPAGNRRDENKVSDIDELLMSLTGCIRMINKKSVICLDR